MYELDRKESQNIRRTEMSRHSSDVFEELIYYSGIARRDSLDGQFELAKLTLGKLLSLINEAEDRLRHESDHKRVVRTTEKIKI